MKHYLIAIGLLVASASLHWGIHSKRTAATKESGNAGLELLPDRVGPYRQHGKDLVAGEEVERVLETSDILMRNYVGTNGSPILLTIVYAGQKRRSLHFPEVCLVGQGWEIEQAYAAPVGIEFEAKRLVIFEGDQKQAVLYWLKTGDHFTSSTFVNAVYWAREQLLFGTPTSSMIKLSVPIYKEAGQTEEAAFAMLDDFASRLGPILIDQVK